MSCVTVRQYGEARRKGRKALVSPTYNEKIVIKIAEETKLLYNVTTMLISC